MARSFGGKAVNISAISETWVRSNWRRNSSQRCCATSSVHCEGETIAGIGVLILQTRFESARVLCGVPHEPKLHLWSRGVAWWFRRDLSVASPPWTIIFSRRTRWMTYSLGLCDSSCPQRYPRKDGAEKIQRLDR